jgi:hypothetical protein
LWSHLLGTQLAHDFEDSFVGVDGIVGVHGCKIVALGLDEITLFELGYKPCERVIEVVAKVWYLLN